MSKPMVEKYEHMLAADPSSTVFVELARAYLDRGDNDRAIAVCQQGITHHPNSVVGRVLWGKALINTGKAADAMKQFDFAVNVDRDNPHAYNLIGEALLRKGLYRSALPILRKASALQPNDARINQWLEQAKAALSGGPAPVLYDSTTVDTDALMSREPGAAPKPSAPKPAAATPPRGTGAPASAPRQPLKPSASAPRSLGPTPAHGLQTAPQAPLAPPLEDPFAAFGPSTGDDPDAQPTQVMAALGVGALRPGSMPTRPAPPVPDDELPLLAGELEGSMGNTQEVPAARDSLEAPDPFAAMTASLPLSEPGSEGTVRGLTETFDRLPNDAVRTQELVPTLAQPDAHAPRGVGNFTPNVPVLATVSEDGVSAQSELPTSEFRTPGVVHAPQQAPAPVKRGGLLDEIPDEAVEAPSATTMPKVEFNTQATEAIAREYERELREKLEVTKQKKTFWQAHGVKVAAVAATFVVLGGSAGSYLYTQFRNQGETLDSALGKALAAANADTKEQYGAAIRSVNQVLQMDEGNRQAVALRGYAQAMLFAEHSGPASDRDAAIAAYADPNVRESRADLALVVDYLTADDATRTAARQQLLGSQLEKSIVRAQAGKLLLADKRYDEALALLTKATELDGSNVRALVALGEYYLHFEDWEGALKMMTLAEPLSKYHPGRVIGAAQARLELGRDTAEALNELSGLTQSAEVPPNLKGTYALVLARAQSVNGRHDDALKTLADAQPNFPEQTLDFALALGAARRNAGLMAQAQKAYEEALKLSPRSEAAKEGLGRVLLARSREKELTELLRAEKELPKISLLRGIAFSRLGDFKRARAELSATERQGKYPAEAAVYLALIDASEDGSSEKAIAALEKFGADLKRNKAVVQVALGRAYLQRGALDKARGVLEDAAKDPQDYEGNALLGELLLKAQVPPEVAAEPLLRAVERNGSHAPSRHLLIRALLAMGKLQEAQKQLDAWAADNPGLEQLWKDAALVNLQSGKVREAEVASSKVAPSSDDLEYWRTRATVLFAKADGRGAMAALERANKLNSKDAETFCEIGNAFVRQGNADGALAGYQAAVREDGKSVCGLAGPLHARPVAKGKPAPNEVLEQLLAKSQNAWEKGFLLATQSRVALAGNDVAKARQAADEALQVAPFHPAAHFASAEVFKREKNEPKAKDEYGRAAELDGSWSQARLAYADALAKEGGASLPLAIAQYEAVLAIDQNDADLARVKKTLATLKKQLPH